MANARHIKRLNEISLWNEWRAQAGRDIKVDLVNANLRKAILRFANLSNADLRQANLDWAKLDGANLRNSDLRGANLCNASLKSVDLRDADLRGANLKYAYIEDASLGGARYSDDTIWPINIIPRAVGARRIRADGTEDSEIPLAAGWKENRVFGTRDLVEVLARRRIVTEKPSSDTFEITFSEHLRPEQISAVLSVLADHYRKCGGVGFITDFDFEEVTTAALAYA
jgi:hypothetical protein